MEKEVPDEKNIVDPRLRGNAAICAPAAHAGTLTTYNITFTGGSPNPTMGSFTYDSTNPQFSNYTVIWDGITFDLTSSANSPTIIGSQM